MTPVADVKAVPDPFERAQLAVSALTETEAYAAEMRDVRDFAFNELVHTQRQSLRAVADRYGLSKSQVANIVG